MKLSLIVAMSENRVIGREGQLPWHISADLRRFKRLTMGHHIIMGRVTWESIRRQLPGRKMIVVTRQADYHADGVKVVQDLDQAMDYAKDDDEAYIIGGGQIYGQALPRVDRLYLTIVHETVAGDVQFPKLDSQRWRVIENERFAADDQCPYAYSFRVLEREADSKPLGTDK